MSYNENVNFDNNRIDFDKFLSDKTELLDKKQLSTSHINLKIK
jgi:hypothetical protein